MPEKELKRLDSVNRFLRLNLTNQHELQHIVELAAVICNTPIAMLTFLDTESQIIKYQVGVHQDIIPIENSICQYTIKQNELMIIADCATDERLKGNDYVIDQCRYLFYAGSPLTTHNNQNIGTFCVCDHQPRELTSVQQKMLRRLARQASQLLEFNASIALLKAQVEHSVSQENKLRSFFESTSSCHLLLDEELRVVSFNKAIIDQLSCLYGLTIEEGMRIEDYVEPTFIKEFKRDCCKALKGGSTRIKTKIASLKGDRYWSLTYDPSFDSEGNINGVSYSANDISQALEYEKTISNQDESFRQIDHILLHELADPMEKLRSAMSRLSEINFLGRDREFQLLQMAFNELQEKKCLLEREKDELIPHSKFER